ncbi:hypothetical protein [Schlesneria paludicola]|uniref:hypothetical protein n=1 Tax=Schlesneria paludicola TaxID=360056 RepID=UPI00029B336C|nr:hypothetical protein [Schlesneria paludicola]
MTIQAVDAGPIASERSNSLWTIRTGIRLFIVLVVISPLLMRMWFVSKVPYIDEPFDVEAFAKIEVPSEDNAFVHYRKAERLFEAARLADIANNEPDLTAQMVQVLENSWETVAESTRLGKWFEARRPALEEWRRGTELPNAQYHLIRDSHWETLLPVTTALRNFGQMAECEAVRLEALGDFSDALKWHVAVMRCSFHSGKYGFAVERLVGISLNSVACQGFNRWSEHRGVTAELLRQAIHEIQRAEQMSAPISQTLKIEYSLMRKSCGESNWIRAIDLATGTSAEEPIVSGLKAYYWLIGEPYYTQMVMRHLLGNQLTEVDKPISERHAYSGKGVALLFNPDPEGLPRHQLGPAAIEQAVQRSKLATAVAAGPLKDLEIAVQRQLARTASLIAALAAQAYQRDHQEYPQQLDEVVPKYLDAVPVDPTDQLGKAVRYHRESPESALIWCVGPDGKDETVDPQLARKLGFGIDLKSH